MSDNNLFDSLKDLMREQMKEAYMEGAHQGSVTTCAVIYQTMRAAGLEEDNVLFLILKDLAKQNGCDNLAEVADKLQSKGTPTSDEPLS